MTEREPKIICGVDVSECTNLINERCVFNYSFRVKDMPLCKDEPNCVFKQRQREIQRKDEKIKELEEELDRYELYKELDEYLEKHCEEPDAKSTEYKLFTCEYKIKKSIECLEQHCKDCPSNYDCKHHNLDDQDCPCEDTLKILKGEE